MASNVVRQPVEETRHRNESLDVRNIMAGWNKMEKRTSPHCATDNITLRGGPDVAAAPVLPPSTPSYTFSHFLLVPPCPSFFNECRARAFLWAVFYLSFLPSFRSFVFFHLNARSFYRASLFDDDQAGPNFNCMCCTSFKCIYC